MFMRTKINCAITSQQPFNMIWTIAVRDIIVVMSFLNCNDASGCRTDKKHILPVTDRIFTYVDIHFKYDS